MDEKETPTKSTRPIVTPVDIKAGIEKWKQYVAKLTRGCGIGCLVVFALFVLLVVLLPKSAEQKSTTRPVVKTDPRKEEIMRGGFKWGLSEENRRKIAREIYSAEKRADREAYRRYPSDPSREMEYSDKLYEKYKSGIRNKHGITNQQLEDIALEGLVKNWI